MNRLEDTKVLQDMVSKTGWTSNKVRRMLERMRAKKDTKAPVKKINEWGQFELF